MKKSKSLSPILLTAVTVILVFMMAFSISCTEIDAPGGQLNVTPTAKPFINKLTDLKLDSTAYFNDDVVQQLPSTVKNSDRLSLIIRTKNQTVVDSYDATPTGKTLLQYAGSPEAQSIRAEINQDSASLLNELKDSGIDYTVGKSYYTLLSGVEIYAQAEDFYKICNVIGNRADVIVGEVYNTCETKVVENAVDVYDTGIFDSSDFAYDGTGTVVAVLDTGLDYYHSAFSISNFGAANTPEKLALDLNDIQALVADTAASQLVQGLTAEDVYINEKVPFAFDYADYDSDVFPIAQDHGTHVAGIIAGKDDTITGVAVNAQLAIMKIFSDVEQYSRTSWILGALEDCVVLGVDVINMSIGTTAGFSRETDKETISGVYDDIRARGINLVVAASNSYNSTYSSEKNGNLGLTSNPDSATVGSPSTYKGALSVASIEGAKTFYLDYNGTIIYFEESSDRVGEEREFVKGLLEGHDGDTLTMEYIRIPGVGRSADYTGIDVRGKIALVSRGSNTFEEKANIAEKQGAAAVIIYNNVSGDIKMNVGDTTIPACSISQDDGELLAEVSRGYITIGLTQAAGPFISDFSSWGPSPDLEIKPEITAHGGSILSSVPGQEYDRISGTSMATPNVSGVTALLRQYVKANFPSIANDSVEVAAMVNKLLMSTADIVYNKNGLPYSVRKQGAGLANLNDCADTTAVIVTYDKNGNAMDKSKVELGDDRQRKGIYELNFDIDNFGTTALSYDLSYYVMTEGVSETKTNDGKTTVTETAYILDGAKIDINSVVGGTLNGTKISVPAGQKASVTLTLTLSNKDKAYLDSSFANGMYVEGFIVLEGEGDTTDLGFPYLAFYGDWTVAPIFDLDYYATNKDELDDSIDLLDKTLPDAYASRPIGGTYADYVSYLGAYYFDQKPGSKMIAADRKYISLSNQEDTINSLRFAWMGMLRNAAKIEVVITEDATGEVVYSTTDYDVRKSYGDGGPIAPANVDIEFSAIEHALKNNTAYTVTLTGYLDYRDGGINTNLNNTFVFPIVTDFEAPIVEDVEFYTEYDRAEKKNRLYSKVAIYDNHYSMAALMGYVGTTYNSSTGMYEFMLNGFDQYLTPIYSERNATSYVIYELTDYVDSIKKSYFKNTFTVTAYDYALNQATYQIELPDEYLDFFFTETEITLSPNELYDLAPLVYPNTEWAEFIEYESNRPDVARVVGGKILAVKSGACAITAKATLKDGTVKTTQLFIDVLAKGDAGYKPYTEPVVSNFKLTGYYTNKAYYMLDNTERKIGLTGDERKFAGNNYALTLYPSESVTLRYDLLAYFPDATTVEFTSANDVVTINSNGTLVAQKEGLGSVTVKVLKNGKSTYFSQSVRIEVKDPYINSGPSLTHYYGLGGLVTIPSTLAIKDIGSFAFSNFDYIEKGPNDLINEEVPELTKQWYIGDNTIEEVIIPEGVETIGSYAFANLTALKKVTFPSTLKNIANGAFYGCTKLKTLVGLQHVKFINQQAFYGCALEGTITFGNTIAIGDYAFAENKAITKVVLSANTQSVGQFAFENNTALTTLTINAEKLKLGQYVFSGCSELTSVNVNAAVIPTAAFNDCSKLTSVTLGKDVAVIGQYAFRNTKVNNFTVANGNTTYKPVQGAPYLTNAEGDTLLLCAPNTSGIIVVPNTVKTIAMGAFSGNANVTEVIAPGVTSVKDYAFAECNELENVSFAILTEIGNYAFYKTAISTMPLFSTTEIGNYAFAATKLTTLTFGDDIVIGDCAFEECQELSSVTIGDNATIGRYAFRLHRELNFEELFYTVGEVPYFYYRYTSALDSLTIGDYATLKRGAFYGAAEITSVTIGEGAYIGDEAFFNADELESIDLSKATYIGNNAFSGDIVYEFKDQSFSEPAVNADKTDYIYRYYASDLTTLDLSAATYLGDYAFAYNFDLANVTLGADVKKIGDYAFYMDESLTSIDLSKVEEIGDYAFMDGNLTSATLTNVVNVGKYAFMNSAHLASVAFGVNVQKIDEGAFAYTPALTTITGLDKVAHVGDYAFAYSALTSADLTNATYVGTYAFIKDAYTAFELTLGDKLVELGDAPFAFLKVAPFSKTVTESFNEKDYEYVTYDFDLNNNFFIRNGSLYKKVVKGLELVLNCSTDDVIYVADNTVRIGSYAFAGNDVKNVVFPYTVASIGHKALYGCDKLVMVTFNSFEAPILEEEYDPEYFYSYENLPTTEEHLSETPDFHGLGITKYYMWNAASIPSNVYYGANFVDYIGKVSTSIIMVRPSNGKHYDTFIFKQYFDLTIDGASAADEVTLKAIALINSLPDRVALKDKALVESARAAYDQIASFEQRALVLDYAKLTAAEKRIKDLEYLENEDAPVVPDAPSEEQPEEAPDETPDVAPAEINTPSMILAIVFTALGLAGAGVFVALYFVKKFKK